MIVPLGRSVPPRRARRIAPGAEPDRRHGEHQGHDGHEYAAAQVAEPERQADQAEHAQRERHDGTLPLRRIGWWQLAGRLRPPGLVAAPARRLISGHRVYSALSAGRCGPVP